VNVSMRIRLKFASALAIISAGGPGRARLILPVYRAGILRWPSQSEARWRVYSRRPYLVAPGSV
jgi:hypothetical protein